MTKYSDVDQELAHEMVVEMLAHQFAYPVKWIDTQDVLLEQQKTERLIEIGPSDTLTVMAKRTIKSQHQVKDSTLSIKRQLLSADADLAEIYYEVAPQTGAIPKVENRSPPLPPHTPAEENQTAKSAPIALASNSSKKPDLQVTALEIIIGIVAQKLKKTSSNISASSTIKSLVSGRSTLENEIIGDLVNEFGSVPDHSEEVVIQDLGKTIQDSFGGRLGKQTSRMVEQLLASKMPGGFSVNTARKYLESQWGFGEGRQDSCLLAAVVSGPSIRLSAEQDAHHFFDDIAKRHAAKTGLSLNEVIEKISTGSVANFDPATLRSLKEEQAAFLRKKLELYAEHLHIDLQAGSKSYAAAQATIKELEAQIDLWSNEHGDVYASGIKPMVDVRKARVYDSCWNWALQDVLSLFHQLTTGAVKAADPELKSRLFRIANRTSTKMMEMLQYLLVSCVKELPKAYRAAEVVLKRLIEQCKRSKGLPAVYRNFNCSKAPRTDIDEEGNISVTEIPRSQDENSVASIFQMKQKNSNGWIFNQEWTEIFLECLNECAEPGINFEDRVVLLTGAGMGSIGSEILGGLLAGGAKVIVTTSSFSLETTRFYQDIYVTYGATGSQLVVIPFNGGSQQDIDSLLTYIYDPSREGLGWDLDAVIPFAAISVKGREIDTVDSRSQLAHRIMMTNTVQLIGAIKRYKEKFGCDTRPAQVILPLSPNHGNFGGDGLYAESKLALESLFSKWKSESWSSYLCICGASIGWTRGTGLMNGNDLMAEEIEKLGVRTFSQQEMAVNILALLSYPVVDICQSQPLYADLNGGLDKIPDLSEVLGQIRKSINQTADVRRALAAEKALFNGASQNTDPNDIKARANIDLDFPQLPKMVELQSLSHLKGMVDLERVVVITGFSELGPYGNSRTRWEMEAYGKLSLEGCLELAWAMGLIKYTSTQIVKGQPYSGWIDAKTNEPVEEWDIKSKYEKHILDHTGNRLVEPELWGGYDPHKKQMLQEVVIEENLKPFEASKETAEAFRREHGLNAEIMEVPGSAGSTFTVCIRKGATLMIPKALNFGNDVTGQIPTGWDARTYGITEDIIASVDRITLFVLVCTVEALLSSGITDPYEIYQYIHTSQVGNCIGTGAGGIISLEKIHRGRSQEKEMSQDILQETFNNTVASWVNMLLLSSNGPIRTPVGACATAIESMDNAYDLIMSGKAKLCLVGGVDDLQENTSYEFANMKATSNGELEHAAGRDPKEMSRPTASTRQGFMESQGCGIQVVCTAKLALAMGLPIYGIVAFTGTSSDKIGRSIPAPGKGVMVNASETKTAFPSPFLDIKFRRRQLMSRKSLIEEFQNSELELLEAEVEALQSSDPSFDAEAYRSHRTVHIDLEVSRQTADALDSLGNSFYKNHPEIAPLRGALATWGLTIDDLDVCSFHGTSTVMNEKNECAVLQRQLEHLGRTKGNRMLGVFQKHLTGHPKGAAGAWMLNGGLQILQTGLVPGNRNADNVDAALEKFDHIALINKPIQTAGIKAFSVFSFGFGQKGAQAVAVHAKYLFATLEEYEFKTYSKKVVKRQQLALAAFNKSFMSNRLFVMKEKAPFDGTGEIDAMLNPNARLAKKL
ncbi:putative 3-oxoacyl-synthase [Calycina marina]|uniref:Fatty acid synthase subunit alpha n=1 Tax=Calycina marina TaxID=1763456 RepID=A0A9P8CCR3_9HELO|nr:putative 3-oxoacyl-synthase [Calycina marina]